MSATSGQHRIGEFSRRVGVSPELLRAWEQRYGLLNPVRSTGGFRLYGDEDARRVAHMQRALDDGLSAAEAARAALEQISTLEPPTESVRTRLLAAVEDYNEVAVQAALDEGMAALGIEPFVAALILPALAEIGARWEAGALEISQEHFASQLIRGRLLALARLWGRGNGPLALLACAPGERHDVSLIAFGVILRSHGWRILFLGADTPVSTVADTTRRTVPAVVVLSTFNATKLKSETLALNRVARRATLFVGGPGAADVPVGRRGPRLLPDDIVEAARAVASLPNAYP